MSAIIIVLGIIMTSTMGFYNINNESRRTLQNREKFQKIEERLRDYAINNGKFPCPSPLNCDIKGCAVQADKFGFEKKDINSKCIADNDGTFASTNGINEKLFYGGVPALTIGLSNNYLVDAWGNKIVYIIPDLLTQNKSLKTVLFHKHHNLFMENVKDGLIYLLISFNKNFAGAFSYNNKISNYFSGNENYPIANFNVVYNNPNYLYAYKQLNDFNIDGFEEELQSCSPFKETIEMNEFNYLESLYGEVAFSNELCPHNVNYPPKSNDYYYLSTYIDKNGIVIDNKPAKKCGKNGKWKDNYTYECIKAKKCSRPSSIFPLKDWSEFNFEIANTGIVYDRNRTVRMKCIVNKDGANWYRVN